MVHEQYESGSPRRLEAQPRSLFTHGIGAEHCLRRPAPERKEEHCVGGRERATQLRASHIDDEGRRAGHWRSPSQSVKAWSPLVVDLACLYRGNRECGRRDSSSRNRE